MKNLLVIAALAAACNGKAQGEENPMDPIPFPGQSCEGICATSLIELNTGLNHYVNVLYSPTTGDEFWRVTHDPANGQVNKCAWVINPAANWGQQYAGSPLPNSNWISHVPGSSYNVVTALQSHCSLIGAPVTFERQFHVCSDAEITVEIVFEYFVDDYLHDIRLDGVSLATYGAWAPGCHANFGTVYLQINLTPGNHNLAFDVYNTDAVDMGFNLSGVVATTGSWLTKDRCLPRFECAANEPPGGSDRVTGISESGYGDRHFIYPNPTQGIFQFDRPVEHIVVTDLTGREILRASGVSEVDASLWEKGTYIVLIEDAGHRQYKKVVKE